MPTDEPPGPHPGQRQCPVCWTWFTPNAANNPNPKRYCTPACRIEDSRRRRRGETTPAPQTCGDEYRYSPPPVPGPCHEHPRCILLRCARFLCPKPVHQSMGPGQPRRFCSPACRVAEHRRLNT